MSAGSRACRVGLHLDLLYPVQEADRIGEWDPGTPPPPVIEETPEPSVIGTSWKQPAPPPKPRLQSVRIWVDDAKRARMQQESA